MPRHRLRIKSGLRAPQHEQHAQRQQQQRRRQAGLFSLSRKAPRLKAAMMSTATTAQREGARGRGKRMSESLGAEVASQTKSGKAAKQQTAAATGRST